MVVNVWLRASQADRLGVGNEVNLMSALGQFQAEFRSDHATAAVCGITSDPNLHCEGPPFRWFCNSMAGTNSGCRFYTERCGQSDEAGYSAGFGRGRQIPGSMLLQMGLKSSLRLFGQAGEFDAHADAGIAGANRG